MTQLVFVHGVATRSGGGYDKIVANRDALFRRVLFEDPGLSIHTPLWGDLVPAIAKDVYNTNAGVWAFGLGGAPSALGMGGGLGGGGASVVNGGPTLADLARKQPNAALDALFVELLEKCNAQGQSIPDDDLAAFARVTAAMAADENAAAASALAADGTAALIDDAATDGELAQAVRNVDGAPDGFSLGSAIGGAIGAVTDRLRRVASGLVVDPLADLARPWVGFFLGDVFTYLYHNDLREQIRTTLREKLLAAHIALAPGEKLVVIGHSMGGVILVDMLSSPAAAGLPADLKVDALLTVGSQPGLFQALGLFLPISASRVPKPAGVETWYNVFDPIDPLAFRADPIFDGVTDLKFDSITGLASAHTTYFLRPQFYARARKRLRDCGVIA